ncbi:glutamate decarboxylase 5-like [Vigna umbellata]|uniref:glutamate decarboxylase 5-like n=1 Tax=Vigna umbellata TaxID=87088 RepID=UPI001F5FB54D|nr:glutamate decarboxylase 5-like [Vigna umbellata]
MENCLENTRVLKEGIERTGQFNIISKDIGVPLLAFSLKDSSQYSVFEISDQLRKFGWIVPAYTMPPDAQHIAVLRVVVREDFSRGLAQRLVSDIEKVMKLLDSLPSTVSNKTAHITAITNEASEKIKKSATETQREIVLYWKRLVGGKKHGAC